MNSQRSILIAMPIFAVSLTSCTSLFPVPNAITSPAPRIFELHISPPQVFSGEITPVLIQFEYADPDGDIDLNSEIVFRFLSDDLIAADHDRFPDALSHNLDSTAGKISKTLQIDTREIYYRSEIRIRVSLIDHAGHESNALEETITVAAPHRANRPQGACKIWFVDQPDGSPADSFRIGREVFVMVRDLTLGVLDPDVLYAEISSPSSAWAMEIPLYKTADPEVYASRLGPRLGVNVPAQSGQTLVAFYRAYSDRAELCLDQAKVR